MATTTMAETCPAFLEGCPYAKEEEIVEWLKERPDLVVDCPAFAEGCPFKDNPTVEGLRQTLERLPPSHRVEGGAPRKAILGVLGAVHTSSLKIKESLGGAECPVFSAACPFKATLVTTDGVPLADLLEDRAWGSFLAHHGQRASATPTSAVDETVSRKLKLGTKKAHRAAENVHYVKEFIRGRVSPETYKHHAASLWFVYSTMEKLLDQHRDDPRVRPVYFPTELHRRQALEDDLDYFWGQNWRQEVSMSPVTSEYCTRMTHLAATAPELLVPHAYTRYLGDLNGGQILRRSLVKAMGLPASGEGARFYEFPQVDKIKAFKQMYRERLDSLPVDASTADRMVDEANIAFDLNTRIFHELDLLAGFSTTPVPSATVFAPYSAQAATTTGAATATATASPAQATDASQADSVRSRAEAAGCPFASMIGPATNLPTDHPSVTMARPQVRSAEGRVSKCPFATGNISLKDVAVFLVMLAAALLLMEHAKPPQHQGL